MLCASSYFEIYNERVRDLLPSTETQGCELRVREHPKDGPYVEGKMTTEKTSHTKMTDNLLTFEWYFIDCLNNVILYTCTYMLPSPLQTPCAELYWGWPANAWGQQEACHCQHRHEPCQQPIPRHLHYSLHQGHKSIYPLLNAICLFVCTFVQIAVAAWSYHLPVCII